MLPGWYRPGLEAPLRVDPRAQGTPDGERLKRPLPGERGRSGFDWLTSLLFDGGTIAAEGWW